MFEKLGRFLYPNKCIICGRFCGEGLTCPGCSVLLDSIREPRCLICGKHLMDGEETICGDCKKKKHIYDYGLGAFEYTEEIKQCVHDLKYNGVKIYGTYLGREMGRRYRNEISRMSVDGIIPVPIHKKRYIKRGYNQAAVIAEAIGKEVGIRVYDNYLMRNKNTLAQKGLSDEERKKNVEKAFIIANDVVKLRKVLIIDDIYTTGATIDECARVLKAAGCQAVYYLSVCIGSGT